MATTTHRQALILVAARAAAVSRSPVTSLWLAEWLECSGAAAGVAREYGMGRSMQQARVSRWSWRRLVAQVARQAAQ